MLIIYNEWAVSLWINFNSNLFNIIRLDILRNISSDGIWVFSSFLHLCSILISQHLKIKTLNKQLVGPRLSRSPHSLQSKSVQSIKLHRTIQSKNRQKNNNHTLSSKMCRRLFIQIQRLRWEICLWLLRPLYHNRHQHSSSIRRRQRLSSDQNRVSRQKNLISHC